MSEPLHVSQGITDLPTPTTDPDAATKKYVDDSAGGSISAVTAVYTGDPVTIADTVQANLTWDTLLLGTELLDRSTLDAPTVLADGIYALSGALVASALTLGGFAVFGMNMHNTGLGFGIEADTILPASYLASVGISPFATTVPFALAAGDAILALCTNADGVASRDFSLFTAHVTKLG